VIQKMKWELLFLLVTNNFTNSFLYGINDTTEDDFLVETCRVNLSNYLLTVALMMLTLFIEIWCNPEITGVYTSKKRSKENNLHCNKYLQYVSNYKPVPWLPSIYNQYGSKVWILWVRVYFSLERLTWGYENSKNHSTFLLSLTLSAVKS
jgi:hypothetical protein